jgi:hypothetical protein
MSGETDRSKSRQNGQKWHEAARHTGTPLQIGVNARGAQIILV